MVFEKRRRFPSSKPEQKNLRMGGFLSCAGVIKIDIRSIIQLWILLFNPDPGGVKARTCSADPDQIDAR